MLKLDDIMKAEGETFESLGVHRGVSRALVRESSIVDYGGWMTYSFFFVNTWNPVGDDPLRPSESTFTDVYSIGEASGTNPVSGSATWIGMMAGIDENENASTFGNLVEGDATVTIGNFAQPAVDIRLTSITDANTGGRHGDISWSGLGLRNGAFSAANISGRFYGPNHEEVGGIFLRNQISGAFGAKRQ